MRTIALDLHLPRAWGMNLLERLKEWAASWRLRGGTASDSRVWHCAACDGDWFRPAAEPPDRDERCLHCDGLLVHVQAPA
jgi:hypothetical protein